MLKITILVLFSLVCISRTQNASNAWNTCEGLSLIGTTITGMCKTMTGQWISTSLDLENCLQNTDGQLTCGSGFGASGTTLTLNGSTLSGNFLNDAGNWVSSSIDLNEVISNDNGNLFCGC